MNKPFLLIAGSSYYPDFGTGDWIARFETREEAEAKIAKEENTIPFTRGKKKGQVRSRWYSYIINSNKYDWYTIVDLNTELV